MTFIDRRSLFQMGHLTLEDYQIWSVKNVLANEFLNLLFQVCLIRFGKKGDGASNCVSSVNVPVLAHPGQKTVSYRKT